VIKEEEGRLLKKIQRKSFTGAATGTETPGCGTELDQLMRNYTMWLPAVSKA